MANFLNTTMKMKRKRSENEEEKKHVNGKVGIYNNKQIAITVNLWVKFAVKFDGDSESNDNQAARKL